MAAQDQGGDGRGAGLDPRTAALGAEAGSLPLPVGTLLERGFVIRSVLGRGGFGVTYMAEHTGLDRRVALKEHFPEQFAIRQGLSVRPTSAGAQMFKWGLDRFLEEAKRLARFKHHSIVDVTDVFEANGTAYMALAYEDGETLGKWLERLGRPPTQAELDRILAPILDALEHVHGHDILHRDIAPDNIMLRRDGTPVLIDFGAARQALAERSQTLTGIVKHGYSPPEQYARTSVRHGPWSDIYALGTTLYRAIMGTAPPEAPDRQIDDTIESVARKAPPSYRMEFLTAIDAALDLKPAERPRSVAEWRRGLLIAQPPVSAARSSTVSAPAEPQPVPSSAPHANPQASPRSASPPTAGATQAPPHRSQAASSPTSARAPQSTRARSEPPPPRSGTPLATIVYGFAGAAVLGYALLIAELFFFYSVLGIRFGEPLHLLWFNLFFNFIGLCCFFFAFLRPSVSHQWNVLWFIALPWIGTVHFLVALVGLLTSPAGSNMKVFDRLFDSLFVLGIVPGEAFALSLLAVPLAIPLALFALQRRGLATAQTPEELARPSTDLTPKNH